MRGCGRTPCGACVARALILVRAPRPAALTRLLDNQLSRAVSKPGIIAAIVLALAAFLPQDAAAQTDYYNIDAGRPVRVEDAYPVEFRGIELQVAPLRIERASGGSYHWEIEPELALGILPRTQVEIGFPLTYRDEHGRGRGGLAGIELSALHNLNVETAIPALGVAGSVLLPAGGFGPDRAYASLKGIVTRTFTWARFHVNGEYTFGARPDSAAIAGSPAVGELSRWWAGLAVDRTFPLRSFLLIAEVVAEEPLVPAEDLRWSTAAGIRYQLDPRWALDAGIGRRLTGDHRAWHLTFGSAYAFGLPWRAR
jgi:hypothetical protein